MSAVADGTTALRRRARDAARPRRARRLHARRDRAARSARHCGRPGDRRHPHAAALGRGVPGRRRPRPRRRRGRLPRQALPGRGPRAADPRAHRRAARRDGRGDPGVTAACRPRASRFSLFARALPATAMFATATLPLAVGSCRWPTPSWSGAGWRRPSSPVASAGLLDRTPATRSGALVVPCAQFAAVALLCAGTGSRVGAVLAARPGARPDHRAGASRRPGRRRRGGGRPPPARAADQRCRPPGRRLGGAAARPARGRPRRPRDERHLPPAGAAGRRHRAAGDRARRAC